MLSDEQIAGLIVLQVAFIGFIANGTIALLIRKLPSLNNSFGSLTLSQSIGDATNCTLFAFFMAPMLIFDMKLLKSNSSIVGHILLVCYDISIYSHVCISVNRFCSIVTPIKYERIFSQSHTKMIIVVSWFIAVLPSFYFFVYSDCRLIYYKTIFAFYYLNTPVCWTISWYAGYLKYNTIVVLIVIIDAITVSKVRSFKTNMLKSTSQSQVKKSRAEMNFLKQACLQASFFVIELFGAFVIMPKLNPSMMWCRFFLTTVGWISVHTLDGLITVAFNKEFIQIIFCGTKIKELSNFASRHNNLFATATEN